MFVSTQQYHKQYFLGSYFTFIKKEPFETEQSRDYLNELNTNKSPLKLQKVDEILHIDTAGI